MIGCWILMILDHSRKSPALCSQKWLMLKENKFSPVSIYKLTLQFANWDMCTKRPPKWLWHTFVIHFCPFNLLYYELVLKKLRELLITGSNSKFQKGYFNLWDHHHESVTIVWLLKFKRVGFTFPQTWSHVKDKRPMGLGALLNNQLGHGPKFQKLSHTLSFYPRTSKLSIFLLYMQRFSR